MEDNYQQILNILLSQIDIMNDIYVQVDDKQYKLDKAKLITIFALNIILVLEGVRIAYRIDDNLIDLIPLVKTLDEKINIIPYPPTEPLIILKENKKSIINMLNIALKKSEEAVHITMGDILGYAYTGSDWQCGYRDTYGINYVAIDEFSNKYILYTFVVPINKYNDDIRQQILDDEKIYNNILERYGYIVIAEASIHLKDNFPNPLTFLP